MSETEIIEKIEAFLRTFQTEHKLNGICVLTVAEGRGSLRGTFIFNYDTKQMLKQYPGRMNTNSPIYKVRNNKHFTINLNVNLKELKNDGKLNTTIPKDKKCYPFCCNNCNILYNRRLTIDNEFLKLKNSSGSSNYIYRVIKKVNYGELVFIKYFKINNGVITEIDYRPLYKVNSFKIYTCKTHNTYYGVDLQTENRISNYHHAKGQNDTEYGQDILQFMEQCIE